MSVYADIIVDITNERLDKTFQYRIPDDLVDETEIGMQVIIPFGKGNRRIKGYIIDITSVPVFDESRIKDICGMVEKSVSIEGKLIKLASFIKENYGGTMVSCLKTVMPVKEKVKQKQNRTVIMNIPAEQSKRLLIEYRKKNNKARVRLFEALIPVGELAYEYVTGKSGLNIGLDTIRKLESDGYIKIVSEGIYRNPVDIEDAGVYDIVLNEEQREIADSIIEDYDKGINSVSLIHGVTGSGKTEVYIELISQIIARGKQAIVLIPEIALTYQTVMRFYKKFGDRVSIINSRLSKGEKSDQFQRAANGEIDIIIGPRSALFTPFKNLGMIIIDEEHESAYKSENTPKYHAREVAKYRMDMDKGVLVLGSATPSIDTYYKCMNNEYRLYRLDNRAGSSNLADVDIVDLREELKEGNKTIFSRRLAELMEDRLRKRQQIMLFINRRGYAGFVSCRACGKAMKCPHCDVSLTSHNNGRLVCHYCGYEKPLPRLCPECGSKYIAAFGTGTQKVEDAVKKYFPTAKVLRMDMDTTRGKDDHEKILKSFKNGDADILVGTQMIVKGHDFPNVTLVGVIAADLSLYANDYRACERTFELLTQAAGRAGRGEEKGNVVIQTYSPDNYSIIKAAKQDYRGFYEEEIAYREVMNYPPVANLVGILIASRDEERAEMAAKLIKAAIESKFGRDSLIIIGYTDASLKKANDIYRKVIYLKERDYHYLVEIKNFIEGYIDYSQHFKDVFVQFDFNPLNTY